MALAALDAPTVTAQALLAHVLGVTRTQLLVHPEQPVGPDQAAAFERLVIRASAGEPLAYLTGRREFYGLEFEVDARVLVPRPETELLVDLARALQPAPRWVLDVGTGSGCLAITLGLHLPDAQVVAVDVSPQALAVARRNASRHGLVDRIDFGLSDLLAAVLVDRPPAGSRRLTASAGLPPASGGRPPASGSLPSASGSLPPTSADLPPASAGLPLASSVLPSISADLPPAAIGAFGPPAPLFDLICANLPYIDSDELRRLPVAQHEPWLALDGGEAGLVLIERLLGQAPQALRPGGTLLLEIGAAQGPAAAALARGLFPAAHVRVHADLAGLDRVLIVAAS